jgi:hypothetical protein
MKKNAILIFILASGVALFFYIQKERKKLALEKEKANVVENYSLSGSKSSASSTTSLEASASSSFHLKILSEPEGARVFVEEESVGETPFDFVIPAESKKLRLEVEGYESFTRQIPASKDAEGDLVWKIQLKKKPISELIPEKIFFKGTLASFLIQMKAIAFEDLKIETVKAFEDENVKFCKVQIKDKIWVRVLKGPYPTKEKALKWLKSVKNEHPEAFITTKQKCF